MNKVWIGVAIAALAAGIGLYVLLSGGDESRAKTAADSVDNPSNPSVPPPTPVRPELPDRTATAGARTDSPGYTEYINDAGVRIRDKRGRVVATDYEKKPRRPFKSLDIEPVVLDRMGRALRNLARKCRKAHGGDLGDGARIQPRVAFEIKEGQLNVTEAELSLTNIKSGGEFERCFYSGALGLAVAAEDHKAIEKHKMLVPIDLGKI